ncbi:MAG: methyl-accepting chemotaxis protein [Clostridiales bacterium]|jgi:methyl-accepting chemotaxis protein|nr:methyl-accepting chemotaxis protein [Eubacteriales bacterium]MDH7566759.1 methyl-accepting chemotaxis protein [Clostridiales bacterium]
MKKSIIAGLTVFIYLESMCLLFAFYFFSSTVKWNTALALVLFSALFLVMIGVSIFMVFRSYIKLIEEIKRNLWEFSRGNFIAEFNPTVKNGYVKEIKEYFEALRNMINDWIYELLRSSVSIKTSSRRISKSSKKAEDGMVELTGNLGNIKQFIEETTAKFMEVADETKQLTQDSRSIADSSSKASQKVNETSSMIQEGGDAVNRVTESMRQIENDVAESSKVMEKLETVSNEIGYIASTISAISEQTNLLALNAAIESARAGEHGRGFAVVADQVRKLADETNQAAGKIKELIQSVQDETQSAVIVMRKVNNEVGVGAEVAAKAGECLGKIIPMVQSVVDIMAGISEDVNRQSKITGIISNNTSEVAGKGQASSSALQEVAAVMEQQLESIRKNTEFSNNLLTLSQNLENVMEKFDGIIGEQMLGVADAVAVMLRDKQLTNEDLRKIAEDTGLSEIHVTDENGRIQLSTDEKLLGYEFRLEKATHVKDFLPILEDPSVRVNQKAKFRGLDGSLYKFVGISKLGSPGIIECGLDASKMVYFKGIEAMKQI